MLLPATASLLDVLAPSSSTVILVVIVPRVKFDVMRSPVTIECYVHHQARLRPQATYCQHDRHQIGTK